MLLLRADVNFDPSQNAAHVAHVRWLELETSLHARRYMAALALLVSQPWALSLPTAMPAATASLAQATAPQTAWLYVSPAVVCCLKRRRH